MYKKKTSKNSIAELMEELRKPYTDEEYEKIHKKIRHLLRIDFIKNCLIPLISFVISILSLILSCKAL